MMQIINHSPSWHGFWSIGCIVVPFRTKWFGVQLSATTNGPRGLALSTTWHAKQVKLSATVYKLTLGFELWHYKHVTWR